MVPSARGPMSMALATALVALSCGGDARPALTTPGAAVAATSADAERASAIAVVPFRTRFELAVDVPPRTLVPDDVRIEARFTSPSGAELTTGGFAWHGSHHVRFTAREVGLYGYVVRADAGGGFREVMRGQIRAAPGGASGFIGLDPADHHRLEREDGEPVYVLGENRIEVGVASGEPDIQGYLAARASEGMRTVRLVVPSALEPTAGRFDERTADAIDAVFDGAERSRVDVVLVPFARGSGSRGGSGGAAPSPGAMFTSPSQRANAVRRLRYVADRWGASPRLLAVELLEEPELDDVVPEATWRPWAEAMRDAWRSFDPYRHLFTSGPALHPTGDDITALHLHGAGQERPHARAVQAARKVAEAYILGKPVLCADFADVGADEALWALTFAGGGVLAPRGAHLDVLSGFLRTFQVAPLAPSNDVRVSRGNARAWTLVAPDALSRGFWLLGPEGHVRAVSGVEIVVPAPPAGRYAVTWVDGATGRGVASSALSSRGAGDVRIQVPAFTGHIAGRMSRDVPLAEHVEAQSPHSP